MTTARSSSSETCSTCGTTIITFDPPIKREITGKSLYEQIAEKLDEVMIPRDDHWLTAKSPEELARIVLDVLFDEDE